MPTNLSLFGDPDPATEGAPAGLSFLPDFLSTEQEVWLLGWIDAQPWSTELQRRVQHYGWKYDYKSRRVDSGAKLGDLPRWATTLGKHLVASNLLPELPDQVIINEYIGAQGIGAHIDCRACFRGPVVTISLGESWEMIFRSPTGEVHAPILHRRSAVVLDGPSRHTWTHEIPRRAAEAFGRRVRRVSITLRTVDL